MSKENGGGSNVDPIVQAIRELGRDLGARIDKTNEQLGATNERLESTNERLESTNARLERTMQTGFANLGARIDKTNERIDVLATATVEGFRQVREEVAAVSRGVDGLGVRLDAVVVNTGEHWRDLDRRVTALETRRE